MILDHKTIGFLVEKELYKVTEFKNLNKKPLVMILGGGKIADQIIISRIATYK